MQALVLLSFLQPCYMTESINDPSKQRTSLNHIGLEAFSLFHSVR